MIGSAGLQENFNHYYKTIMERSETYALSTFQRNRMYEQFRMAEAFYKSLQREPSLTGSERMNLDSRFRTLKERVLRIQQQAGDQDLRAV